MLWQTGRLLSLLLGGLPSDTLGIRAVYYLGFVVLPRRWVVECTFAWLTKHRRLVRDYETLPETHEAMVWAAGVWTLSRRLAR